MDLGASFSKCSASYLVLLEGVWCKEISPNMDLVVPAELVFVCPMH
jgi:hypothetical protein